MKDKKDSVTNFVLIPTYNEHNNIRVLVEKIFSLYPAIHILVIDDGSPDGTAAVVQKLQRTYSNLHLKQRPSKLGLASAYLGAFKDVLNEHPTVQNIITMDADLSHNPVVIGTMLKEVEQYDLVIGSRYIQGGGVKNWELSRRLLSLGGNLYARLVTISAIHDLTAGFVCYRASLLKRYDFDSLKAAGYGYQMEMKIVAHQLGAKIKEVPIIFGPRIEGQSKISNHIIYEGLIVPWRFSPFFSSFRSKRHR
ncbi:MAG: polyprenol monophosphomannose synthase [Patescibacteria group bacterium]|nr:polyprenol monophosphomannose synthase [Patescibacteria group bacterium]